jgi:hypothetical protein
LLGTACREPARVLLADGPLAGSGELRFAPLYVGAQAERTLTLENAGRTPRTLRLALPAPFAAASDALTLAPGEARRLAVRFHPTAPGAHAASLVLEEGGRTVHTVSLAGEALAPLACAPPGPCRTERFDPESGACVAQVQPDGRACEDACLSGATCRAGACVGTPRGCDDGDACTADGCAPGRGCQHAPVTCAAPEDPCQSARCDPAQGCVVSEVADGTPCGPPPRCWSGRAHACLAGACQPVSATLAASCPPPPCSPGEAEGAGELRELWSHAPGASPWGAPPLADAEGNLYWSEYTPYPSRMEVVSLDAAGRLRFRADLGSEAVGLGELVMVGPVVLVREPVRLRALSPVDGRVLWTLDLRALVDGLQPFPRRLYHVEAGWALAAPDRLAGVLVPAWDGGNPEGTGWQVQVSVHDGAVLEVRPALERRPHAASVVSDRTGTAHGLVHLGETWRLARWDLASYEAWEVAPHGEWFSAWGTAVAEGALVQPVDAGLHVLDARSGALRARVFGDLPLVQDGLLVAATAPWGRFERVAAHDLRSAELRWQRALTPAGWHLWLTGSGALLAHDQRLVGCDASGEDPSACPRASHLRAFALADGAPLWECRIPRPLGLATLTGGRLVGWTQDAQGRSRLVAYDVSGWELATTGWPQVEGGPERQRRERGP